MKSNYFKYIFIIFAIGIMVFAVVKINKEQKNTNIQSNESYHEEVEEVKELNLGVASFDSINPILSNNKNIQDISKIIFEPLLLLHQITKLKIVWLKNGQNKMKIRI